MKDAIKQFLASPTGQAIGTFVRVALATIVGLWLSAGTPIIGLDPAVLLGWVETGLQSGVALVLANYFGPWETRYGVKKRLPVEGPR